MTTATLSPTARFLLDRIDEAAEAATVGSPKWDGDPTWWMPDFVTRDYLLADLKAKGDIIRLLSIFGTWAQTDPSGYGPRVEALEQVVRYFVQAYADHPDFLPEWRLAES